MDQVRSLLLLVLSHDSDTAELGNSGTTTNPEQDLPDESQQSVSLHDVVDAEQILRVTRFDASEDGYVADFRVFAGANSAHLSLQVPRPIAAKFLASAGTLGRQLEQQLEKAGLAGEILLAALTSSPERVDQAAQHSCALVRLAAAVNQVPTQRHYNLASDACRDVALVALANRSAQEVMTYQFRRPLDVADGYRLSECPCGAASA